jgi:hypothetical protein
LLLVEAGSVGFMALLLGLLGTIVLWVFFLNTLGIDLLVELFAIVEDGAQLVEELGSFLMKTGLAGVRLIVRLDGCFLERLSGRKLRLVGLDSTAEFMLVEAEPVEPRVVAAFDLFQ